MPVHPTRWRVVVATIATAVLLAVSATLQAGGTSAATVVLTWKTRIGPGAGDMATLYAYQAGNGALRFSAATSSLTARSTYPVTIHKGGCPWFFSSLGTTLATLPGITPSAGGAVRRSVAVSAASVKKVRSAWSAGAGVVLVIEGSHSFWCYEFAAVGRMGESVRLGNEQVHVVTRAEHWTGPAGVTLEGGAIFATFYVRVTARQATGYRDNSYALLDPDGSSWTMPIVVYTTRQPALDAGELAAGQSAEGWVTIGVPPEAHDALTLAYYMGDPISVLTTHRPVLYVPLGTLADEGSSPTPSPTPTPVPTATPLPTSTLVP